MVVNYNSSGWEVITQRCHGSLAAQFAMQWNWKQPPARWTEVVLAVAEHDDGEVEFNSGDLLTSAGGPVNFSMKKFDAGRCTKLARIALSRSRYVALLTSMHMVFLYEDEARENKEADAFLQAEKEKQKVWISELSIDTEEMKKVYSLLQWCDALSLLLSQRQIQPENRSVEISVGPDGVAYHLVQVDEESLTVQPWPFKQPAFPVHFESRTIAKVAFESTEDFRQALLKAPVQETVWKMVQQSSSQNHLINRNDPFDHISLQHGK